MIWYNSHALAQSFKEILHTKWWMNMKAYFETVHFECVCRLVRAQVVSTWLEEKSNTWDLAYHSCKTTIEIYICWVCDFRLINLSTPLYRQSWLDTFRAIIVYCWTLSQCVHGGFCTHWAPSGNISARTAIQTEKSQNLNLLNCIKIFTEITHLLLWQYVRCNDW